MRGFSKHSTVGRVGTAARIGSIGLVLGCSSGCAVESAPSALSTNETVGSTDDAVKLDTSKALQRRQYDANLKFANAYKARCGGVSGKRVIVTGYGKFQGNLDNASGRIIESLTGAPYPKSALAAPQQVDPPEAQTSVRSTKMYLNGIGEVTICGLILPVYWDLAPILLAKEIDAFKPDLVLMNGVATGRRGIPMRLELGSQNQALPSEDGSGILRPFDAKGAGSSVPVIAGAPDKLASLMSWDPVKRAMTAELARQTTLFKLNTELTQIDFGGYPSDWLTYLCNNIIFVTNYLMANPGKPVRLLEPSSKLNSADQGISVALSSDFSRTPRAFMHWPDLSANQRPHAAEILRAAIGAQLQAQTALRDAPTPGDPKRANQF
jgi:hypothetical protein